MSLIKKPSELETKQTLTALIYGQAGVGKSSLACSAPNAVMFDFDGGVSRMNGAHQVDTVQVRKWEEVLAALEEVKGGEKYRTIIIDTVGKMMAYMEEYIKRTNPRMKQGDGSLSLKGFGMRKQMFLNFIHDIAVMGRNVIFVAHEIEQKRGEDTVVRPEIGGSSGNDLMKELDLVGYMEMYGDKRTISFSPSERFYAKNTCDMPGVIAIPVVVDEYGEAIGENHFLSAVIDNYHRRIERNKEQTAQYEALCDLIDSNVADIENAEDANNFVEWIKGVEHVYNSKAYALNKFGARCSALNLTFNKATKTYSDPVDEQEETPKKPKKTAKKVAAEAATARQEEE